jgi:hypothetical protein
MARKTTPTTRGRAAGRAATAVQDDETSVEVRAKKKTSAPKPAADSTAGGGDQETVADALGVVPGMLGGKPRQTQPSNANMLSSLPFAFIPRRSYQGMDLTTIQAGAYSPQQLLELLADAWPELSQALWNILRLAAAEWRYAVKTPDKTSDDPVGKAELDQILGRVNANWGGFDALINQWVACVALQGACAGETIPTEDIDDVWDIVTVQPWSIFFQRDDEQRYVAYQWQPMTAATGATGQSGTMTGGSKPGVFDPTAKQPSPAEMLLKGAANSNGGYRALNTVTFAYVPLDADVDDPYGRTPFGPVLQLVVWDMQVIKDLRQWSHVNAFGRVDVKVVQEAAAAMMPPMVRANKKEARLWLRKYLEDIQSTYNGLGPDDTYIHYDNVEVETKDPSGKTFDIDKLIKVLERRLFRALKQLPILMGSNEGTTETWGTLQMEVYALGIANIQRTVASLIEKLLNVALRLRGFNSVVEFEFETLRATDRGQLALAEWQEAKNAAFMRDQGWITQDEASIRITGSEAVADAPQPDNSLALGMPDMGSKQPVADPADALDPNDPNAEQETGESQAGTTGAKGKGDGKKKPADEEDDEAQATEDSDRWQRRSHPIRGLDVPMRRPATSRRGRPAGTAPAVLPAARLAPRLDRHERTALGEALAATIADLAVAREAVAQEPVIEERASSGSSHRGPSAARKTLHSDAEQAVADYFASSKLARSRLDHIIDLHRSEATVGNKRTWPPLADAVQHILDAARAPTPRDVPRDGLVDERLSDEEREALLLSIIKMLEADYRDADSDLRQAIYDARLAAYNLGGNEGLELLGLATKGTFNLTNDDLLDALREAAHDQAKLIQQTSRQRVGKRIADGLIAGDTNDQIAADISAVEDSWGDYRAANIGLYETDAGYFSGSIELWDRCGIPKKVWKTAHNPDPGAGASGATPCRDNAYGSPVPIYDPFPSGHYMPPAHNYCQCDVVPEGDPSDAAAESPWLGD